jgi:hypothetical protein
MKFLKVGIIILTLLSAVKLGKELNQKHAKVSLTKEDHPKIVNDSNVKESVKEKKVIVEKKEEKEFEDEEERVQEHKKKVVEKEKTPVENNNVKVDIKSATNSNNHALKKRKNENEGKLKTEEKIVKSQDTTSGVVPPSPNTSQTASSNKNLNETLSQNLGGPKPNKHNGRPFDPFMQYYSEEDQFFYVRNIKCEMSNCPPPSFCMDASTCKCGEGHANVYLPDMPPMNFYCQYRQKQQLVGFLLETFLSMGIGHFYAGRTSFGLIKLLICLSPLFLMCCAACCGGKDAGCCILLSSALTCTIIIWQILDMINFATNSYKDGYGVPLNHW